MAFTDEDNRNNYQGNGTAGPFAFNGRITAETDILVAIRDTANTSDNGLILTLTTHYTVANVGSETGASVTLLAPYDALNTGYKICLIPKQKFTQPTGFRNLSDWPAAPSEEAHDRVMRASLQQQDSIDRTLRFGETIDDSGIDPHPNPPLPVPVENGALKRTATGWDFVSLEHTGEVTGETALTVDKTAISNKDTVIADPLDTLLIGDSDDGDKLKKTTIQSILDASTTSVNSVNGKTGTVVIDPDDLNDAATTKKFTDAATITKMGNISVTQAVDLDTMESDIATNTARVASGVPFMPDGDIAATDVQASIVEVRDDTDTKLTAKEATSNKGSASGYAPLDGGSKVPLANLPDSVKSGSEYKGAWNASTNSPSLVDGTGTNGDYYRVSVAGTQDLGSGSKIYAIGDLIVYDGTTIIWDKIDGDGSVASVNGKTGTVVIDADDISDAATTNKFNVTHTGEVIGSNALTVDKTLITNKTLTAVDITDRLLLTDTSNSNILIQASVQNVADLKVSELSEDTSPVLAGPLATNSNQVRWSQGADIASATSLILGDDGNFFNVTGTTTIDGIGLKGIGTVVILKFSGALTLTNDGVTFDLPASGNITTVAGDRAMFVETNLGGWSCVEYLRATGAPLIINGSNVTDLPTGALASGDLVAIVDISTGNVLQKVTAQSIADLGGGGGGILAVNATGTDNIGTDSIGAFGSIAPSAAQNLAIGTDALAVMTTGAENTAIGDDAGLVLTTATRNTLIGVDAGKTITTGSNNVSIGFGSGPNLSSYTRSVSIGSGAVIKGNDCTVVGQQASAVSEGIAIGKDANAAFNESIAIGRGARTSVIGQMAVGGYFARITDVRIGQGSDSGNTAPQSLLTLQPSPALGTNFSGTQFNIRGGNNTGTGAAGKLVLQTGSVQASGTTAGVILDRITITETAIVIDSLPTSDPANTGQLWNSSGTVMISA